ncbi:MAG: esterase, partial [Gemmatimonadota bacterium]|nr:esterase [Gemmatimonadota bacterium]
MRRLTLLLLTLVTTQAGADPNMSGTDRITYFGYEDCILLENAHTRVVLTSSAGRVLEYSRKGPNAIYLDPAQEGATFEDGDPRFGPTGGRLDIGPEMIIPAHPDLWLGQWESQITGPRSARLISKKDEPTGVQLIRDFQLAEDSTYLSVTQTIKNVSDSAKHWGHWSRTFGTGGGIVLIPLTPSRFPDSYVMYGPG